VKAQVTILKTTFVPVLSLAFLLLVSLSVFAQGPTTGRIAGTVKDQNGAVVVGAEVTVTSKATGDQRVVVTNAEGNYTVPLLPPGAYQVRIKANGFASSVYDPAQVVITETTRIEANLMLAEVDTVSVRIDPLVQADGPQLGRVVDSRAVSELPLATRNLTQILGLSPGASVDLANNTAVGRNPQNISVNGARTTQNTRCLVCRSILWIQMPGHFIWVPIMVCHDQAGRRARPARRRPPMFQQVTFSTRLRSRDQRS
jgi:hypothetical protein